MRKTVILFLLLSLLLGLGSGHFKGRKNPVPVPIADYNVTGTITPDATCNYFSAGTYNGKTYYRRADGAYFLWWYADDESWIINTSIKEPPTFNWFRDDVNIIGKYYPRIGVSGNPVVAAGPH